MAIADVLWCRWRVRPQWSVSPPLKNTVIIAGCKVKTKIILNCVLSLPKPPNIYFCFWINIFFLCDPWVHKWVRPWFLCFLLDSFSCWFVFSKLDVAVLSYLIYFTTFLKINEWKIATRVKISNWSVIYTFWERENQFFQMEWHWIY